MRRAFLAIGVVSVIAGVLLAIIPYVRVPNSSVWLNETFVVPAGRHYCYTTVSSPSFPRGVPLHITFDVAGADSIDFRVMNESSYLEYNSSQPYGYYVEPSRSSIARMDLRWTPPVDEKIYFVWGNQQSHVSKSISAYFSLDTSRALLPSVVAVLGLLPIFGGIATLGYGARLPIPPSRKQIITGYILATLGGLLGIMIGFDLAKKEDQVDRFHGKIISILGIVSTISFVLLYFLH